MGVRERICVNAQVIKIRIGLPVEHGEDSRGTAVCWRYLSLKVPTGEWVVRTQRGSSLLASPFDLSSPSSRIVHCLCGALHLCGRKRRPTDRSTD